MNWIAPLPSWASSALVVSLTRLLAVPGSRSISSATPATRTRHEKRRCQAVPTPRASQRPPESLPSRASDRERPLLPRQWRCRQPGPRPLSQPHRRNSSSHRLCLFSVSRCPSMKLRYSSCEAHVLFDAISSLCSHSCTPLFKSSGKFFRPPWLPLCQVNCLRAIRFEIEELPCSTASWANRFPTPHADDMMLRYAPTEHFMPVALMPLEDRQQALAFDG